MSICSVVRCVAVAALAVFVSGCFSGGSGQQWSSGPADSSMERRDDCRWNRSSCIYEGSYETGERDYAEEEAKRLNRASLQRLNRGRSWW